MAGFLEGYKVSVRDKFFEDLATALDSWVNAAVASTTDPEVDFLWTEKPESFKALQAAFAQSGISKNDVRQVFLECLNGLTNSTLTIIDGGTALAEQARIRLVDEKGESLGEGLHDDFALYLLDTGRLSE